MHLCAKGNIILAMEDTLRTKSVKMWGPIICNGLISVIAYIVTVRLIPKLKEMFIKANLFGIDMSKRTGDKV